MEAGPVVIAGRKCPNCGRAMERYIRLYDPLAGMTERMRQETIRVTKPEFLKPKPVSLFVCEPCNYREAEESLG